MKKYLNNQYNINLINPIKGGDWELTGGGRGGGDCFFAHNRKEDQQLNFLVQS